MAQCLRGHGLEERKRVLLEQIWRPGRLMEGLFPLSGSSCFMARFDFHSCGVKVWGWPPGASKAPYCTKVCSLSRGDAYALLTSQPPHMVPFHSLVFHPSPLTLSDCCGLPLLVLLKPGRQPETVAALTAPAINNQAPALVDYLTGSAAKPERGNGYKGRRHLVSPRRVSVCPERGCVIDHRKGKKIALVDRHFSPVFLLFAAVAWCLFMSLTRPPFQIK